MIPPGIAPRLDQNTLAIAGSLAERIYADPTHAPQARAVPGYVHPPVQVLLQSLHIPTPVEVSSYRRAPIQELAQIVARIPVVPRNCEPGGQVVHFGSLGLPIQIVLNGRLGLDELKFPADVTFTAN